MRRQSLIALGIAVVLGLFAVYLANVFLTNNQRVAEEATVRTAKVAVAVVPLDYGVELTPDKVRLVDYPVNSIPAGSYSTVNDLLPAGKKRVALRPMQVNEPILASKLMGEGLSASLAALLPDGKRATAVRVNDVSGVAGFIQPNDTVDVLITRQAGNNTQATDVLLQAIRVIAIDQNAKDANGQPVLARTATLEVNPIDAQKLVLGQQAGSLSLVLRKPGDEQNIPAVETVSMSDLRYNLYAPARLNTAVTTAIRPRATTAAAPRRPAPRPVSRPAPPVVVKNTKDVEVVRGTKGSNYEVGEYGS